MGATSNLEQVARAIRDCGAATSGGRGTPSDGSVEGRGDAREGCAGIVYVRSPLMPVSAKGVQEVGKAAPELGIRADVLDAAELYFWLEGRDEFLAPTAARTNSIEPNATDSVAAMLIAAGGTVHLPSLLVYRDGNLVGKAILGFKTACDYRRVIAGRLAGARPSAVDPSAARRDPPVRLTGAGGARTDPGHHEDVPLVGPAGAYFRWVPGATSVAYEMEGEVYLLDLDSGARTKVPL